MFRLNFFTVTLCLAMKKPYQFYYFVPLVSFWFTVLYVLLAVPCKLQELCCSSDQRKNLTSLNIENVELNNSAKILNGTDTNAGAIVSGLAKVTRNKILFFMLLALAIFSMVFYYFEVSTLVLRVQMLFNCKK